MRGGLIFFRGEGSAARAYLESDHSHADEYYLEHGASIAQWSAHNSAAEVTEMAALAGEQYQAWVDWKNPLTNESRGVPREVSRISKDGEIVKRAASPRFVEMTVNADKSLSVAAALSPKVSAALDGAQQEAVDAMNAYMAEHSVTRLGPLGAQVLVPVERLESVAVVHRSSRAGDPHRHVHLQWSTRVYAEGKWRSLHTAATLKQQGALRGVGEAAIHNNVELRNALAEEGFTFDAERGIVVELEEHSRVLAKRSKQIERNVAKFERAWREEHPNREPSKSLQLEWNQKAWSFERPRKRKVSGNPEPEWREELVREGLQVDGFAKRDAAELGSLYELDRAQIIESAVHAAEQRSSAWSIADLEGYVGVQLAKHDVQASAADVRAYVREVALEIVNTSPQLDVDVDGQLPDWVRYFTSDRVQHVEGALRASFRARGLQSGLTLDVGELDANEQQQAAQAIGSRAPLVVIEGAAGSGKTTMLAQAREVASANGMQLLVLAPTLRAAHEAGRSLSTEASSLHRFVWEHGFRWDSEGVWSRLDRGELDAMRLESTLQDAREGKQIAVHVTTDAQAAIVNAAVQQARFEAGHTSAARVDVFDSTGTLLHVGDRVIVHDDDAEFDVQAGSSWTVQRVHRDGSVSLDDSARSVRVSEAFMQQAAVLGYASTSYDRRQSLCYLGAAEQFKVDADRRIVVDEAGMVDQDVAHALTTIADEAGAPLAFVGDRQQLPAVGRGGVLDMAVDAHPRPIDIQKVHRFRDDAYAELSKQLRSRKNPEALFDALYERGNIVLHDSADDAQQAIVEDAVAKSRAGASVAVAVASNEYAEEVNSRVQEARAAAGLTSATSVSVEGSDGLTLRHGDRVMTRKNSAELGVTNRETWIVKKVQRDGSVVLASEDRAQHDVQLPNEYVTEHTHLAYASTVYGVQGATVDYAHTIVDDSTNAAALYVGATRGRETNLVHVVVRDPDEAREMFVDVMNRESGDRGLASAASRAARDVEGLQLGDELHHDAELREERIAAEQKTYETRAKAWQLARDRWQRKNPGQDPDAWHTARDAAAAAVTRDEQALIAYTAVASDTYETQQRTAWAKDWQAVEAARLERDHASLIQRKRAARAVEQAEQTFVDHHGQPPAPVPETSTVHRWRELGAARDERVTSTKAALDESKKQLEQLESSRPSYGPRPERKPVGTPVQELEKDAAFLRARQQRQEAVSEAPEPSNDKKHTLER